MPLKRCRLLHILILWANVLFTFTSVFLFPWFIHTHFPVVHWATYTPTPGVIIISAAIVTALTALLSYGILVHPHSRWIRLFRDYQAAAGPTPEATFRSYTAISLLTLLACSTYILFMYQPWFHHPDEAEYGVLEMTTAGLFIAAAVVLVFSARRLRRRNSKGVAGLGRGPLLCYLLVAALCFLYGMEEISLGQWIFHWRTPASWANQAFQPETNIHNLVGHEWYRPAYLLLSIIFLAVMAGSAAARFRGARSTPLALILPHPGFLLPAAIIFLLNISSYALAYEFPKENELQEYLASFVVFHYSLMCYERARSSKRSPSVKEHM